MMNSTYNRLKVFQAEQNAYTKGPLSLLVQLTEMVQARTFPLNQKDFLTENKGQIAGLGGANLKKILKKHGITRTLSSEGGRTSRGNMGLMIKYIEFLNSWKLNEDINFSEIEDFWSDQVRNYFNNLPFTLNADPSRSIGASLDELFEQAKKRQKENPGTQYLGTMIQHLVAAKLSLILPPNEFKIHGASVADSPTNRSGDFVIHNMVLHCTTAPGEPLIQKCKANIRASYFPVIITIFDRVRMALDLANDADLNGRIEVWDIQQFLSTNINEHSMFNGEARNSKIADIIKKYNDIIDQKETDASLRIEFEAN